MRAPEQHYWSDWSSSSMYRMRHEKRGARMSHSAVRCFRRVCLSLEGPWGAGRARPLGPGWLVEAGELRPSRPLRVGGRKCRRTGIGRRRARAGTCALRAIDEIWMADSWWVCKAFRRTLAVLHGSLFRVLDPDFYLDSLKNVLPLSAAFSTRRDARRTQLYPRRRAQCRAYP
ncbi:hypothetical protein C8F01DRAFT_173092 [Mycena amicta]|nr:hypothetical protein C8F01DRAFT_173092 [Mycena amicta]